MIRSRVNALPERQRDVLAALAIFEEWARPLDIGAHDGSNHRASLQALVKKSLVEQRVRKPLFEMFRGTPLYKRLVSDGPRKQPVGAHEFRITQTGRELVGTQGTR